MLINLADLHFIRPWWLLAFLPLIIYLLWYWFFQGHKSDWQNYLDAGLAKYMLTHEANGKSRKWLYALCILIAASLVILALAGPAWEKIPQPVFKNKSALVVVLDLSRSMDSVDLKPSRLVRAKQKLSDLLPLNKGGQTALVVYAANAYVVTPLTDDIKTIATHIPNLSTNIIQAQGSRPDKALLQAKTLLKQANIRRGQIVLLTDGFELNKQNKLAISELVEADYSLSIIGVGTAAGAPIVKRQSTSQQKEGGFVTDAQGNIVIPKLDANALRKAAQLGGGRYASLTVDEKDLQRINIKPEDNKQLDDKEMKKTERTSDEWNDLGAYLLFLVIPFVLLGFRRGLLFGFGLVVFMMMPVERSYAVDISSLFLNKNQQAKRAFDKQQYDVASDKFTQPEWQASSAYKQGQYQQAIDTLAENNNADALYNKGNAYAKMGKLQQAIEQYETSLQLEPNNPDAEYNLELVKKALDQQKQQQQSQDQQQDGEPQDNQQQENESQDQQSQNAQSNEEESQSEQNQSSQSADNAEQNEPQNSEQQNQSDEDSTKENENADSEQADEATEQEGDAKDNDQQATDQLEQEQNQTQAEQPVDMTEEENNQQQLQQWLRRIEDDPSGLLRRKFRYQDYINKQQAEEQQW